MRLTGHICTHVGNLASLLKMYLIVPQVVQSSPAPTTNSTTAPVTRRADGPTQSTTGTDCARWNVTVLLLSKCISLCRKFTVTMYFTVPQVVRSSSAPMIKFMTAPVAGSKVNYEQCFLSFFPKLLQPQLTNLMPHPGRKAAPLLNNPQEVIEGPFLLYLKAKLVLNVQKLFI